MFKLNDQIREGWAPGVDGNKTQPFQELMGQLLPIDCRNRLHVS